MPDLSGQRALRKSWTPGQQVKFAFFCRELVKPWPIAAGSMQWLEDDVFAALREMDPKAEAVLDITARSLFMRVSMAFGGVFDANRTQSAAAVVPCIACTRPDKNGRWMVVNPLLGCQACGGERTRVDLTLPDHIQRAHGERYLAHLRGVIRQAKPRENAAA